MRRFAPALGGRLSRRDIALSPHLWSATGAVFAIFAISVAIIAFVAPEFDGRALLIQAGALTIVAGAILAARPPEPGSLASHAVLAATYLTGAGAMLAFSPQGSAPLISGVFTGPLLAIWLRNRWHIVAHLALASALFLSVALLGGSDAGTLFAVLCFVPATWVLTASCVIVLEAVEAQGEEYERLGLTDPLTGVGNRPFIDESLAVELTRHRSVNQPLSLVELQLVGFDAVNASIGRAAGDAVLVEIAAVLVDLAPSAASTGRTAGDRFTVLLPGTAGNSAHEFVARVRSQIARIDAGPTELATSVGVASFPADGTRTATLRTVAGERAAAAAPERAPRPPEPTVLGGLTIQTHDLPPLPETAPAGTPSPEAREGAWASTRVDRRGIARDRLVWRLTGLTFLLYAALATAGQLITDVATSPATLAVTAAAALSGLAIFIVRPPQLGTRANHAVVTATWALPIAAMAACAPHASWAAGTAVFSGVVVATRLTDRRHIGAHLLAASGTLWALILIGRVDAASVLAILTLLLSTWVLAICCTTVFEAAEAQGRRMAELVLRDPLTGAGNQRLIRERLVDELPRHRDMQMPLVVLELELTGLRAVAGNDGRGAAADVLRDVAVLLASIAGPDATVARIQAKRFRVLVPLADPDELAVMVLDMRRAIASTSRRARPILPRIGMAAFPEDGETEDELVAVAAQRMNTDDPRAHDLSTAPDPLDEPLPVRRVVEWPGQGAAGYAERRRSAG